MDDDEPSLRSPLIPRGGALVVVAVTAAVLVVLFVAPRVLDWRARRDRAAAEEAAAPYENEGRSLEAQLRARLAPLAAPVDAADAPARCPDAVTGDVAFVIQPWLTHAFQQGPEPAGHDIASPAFAYLCQTLSPSANDVAQLDTRNAAFRALLAEPYAAVLLPTQLDPIKHTGVVTFEGGRIAGTLAIYDVAHARVACAGPVDSHPDVIVSVRQTSAEGQGWADREAERDAVATALWRAVTERVAELAPRAHLVTP